MRAWEEAPAMADTFGCPEFFATHVGAIEDAGCGNVRIVKCIKRNGMLLPVFSCVTPATIVLQLCPQVEEAICAIIKGFELAH